MANFLNIRTIDFSIGDPRIFGTSFSHVQLSQISELPSTLSFCLYSLLSILGSLPSLLSDKYNALGTVLYILCLIK